VTHYEAVSALPLFKNLKQNKMDLDKKTSIRVSFYNHDTEEINSWPLEPSNIRLVLLMKTLTSEKEKLENENISEEKKKDIIDFVCFMGCKKIFRNPFHTKKRCIIYHDHIYQFLK